VANDNRNICDLPPALEQDSFVHIENYQLYLQRYLALNYPSIQIQEHLICLNADELNSI